MMGFNPSLTSGFSGYCFLCGNKCGSLSLTTTGIAFCARPTDFPSAHTLGYAFCSTKGREREGSIFMKTEAWTLLSIPLPKRGEGDSGMIRNAFENSTESQLLLRGWLKYLAHPDSPIMEADGGESGTGASVSTEYVSPVPKGNQWSGPQQLLIPGVPRV